MYKPANGFAKATLLTLLFTFRPFLPSMLSADEPVRVELRLERGVGDEWKPVHPGFVCETGDSVRFRIQANFAGWLYVVNRGTSGKQTVLFPAKEAGSENYIEADHEYTIPSERAKFRITGPAGYEVIDWILSPERLPDYSILMPNAEKREPAPGLLPRCDDTLFQARGECIDASAGPRSGPDSSRLSAPQTAPSSQVHVARDRDLSIISSGATLKSPVVYQFRIAHK